MELYCLKSYLIYILKKQLIKIIEIISLSTKLLFLNRFN